MNSCTEGLAGGLQDIVLYSHFVSAALTLLLVTFTLIKTRFSKLALIFFSFGLLVSFWLIADLIAWGTVPNYYLTYFFWSLADFMNIAFFVLGAYFFGVLARGNVSIGEKLAYVALCVPAFLITVSGNSVVEFNQAICEAANNSLLTEYKLFAEGISVLLILASLVLAWGKADVRRRVQLSILTLALLLFFGVFAGTEYISSISGIYEINLYGLFVLPLFLLILTFAITDLKLFQLRFVGTQILAYVLVVLVGSELLFITDSVSRNLTLVTLAMSLVIALLLIENARTEAAARVRIEELAKDLSAANERLKELDQMKSEFLSIASHQLRAPITAVRGYAANIVEGEYGPVPDNLKEPLATVQETARLMVNSIEDYLDISRIEQGRMKYEKSDFDLADIARKTVNELTPVAVKKKLALTISAPEDLLVNADIGKTKQVITNLIDNAVKYTTEGSVTVTVEKKDTKARITIADTGVGIAADEIGGLFEKFKRARGANKVNTTGTGLGLYVAKQLTEGSGGKIWAESDGAGKGSRFIVELPAK